MREKEKVKTGISQLIDDNGNMTATDKETADVLSNFFQSVVTQEQPGDTPTLESKVDEDEQMNDIYISQLKT